MVEPVSDTGEPVNSYAKCALPPGPGPAPVPKGSCAAQLKKDGCLPSTAVVSDALDKCEKCAEAHEADLKTAGCTSSKEVAQLCGALLS
eukprot:UC4_evm2s1469